MSWKGFQTLECREVFFVQHGESEVARRILLDILIFQVNQSVTLILFQEEFMFASFKNKSCHFMETADALKFVDQFTNYLFLGFLKLETAKQHIFTEVVPIANLKVSIAQAFRDKRIKQFEFQQRFE